MSKTELVQTLAGTEPPRFHPELAGARVAWNQKVAKLARRTRADLRAMKESRDKLAAVFVRIEADARIIQPTLERLAQSAGASWRGAINAHLKDQGATPIPNTTKGETVAIAARKLAEHGLVEEYRRLTKQS